MASDGRSRMGTDKHGLAEAPMSLRISLLLVYCFGAVHSAYNFALAGSVESL